MAEKRETDERRAAQPDGTPPQDQGVPQAAAEKHSGDGEARSEDAAQHAQEEAAQRVTALEAQVAELRETALRARAELDNVRKRHARELQNAHRYGAEKLAAALLPVVDSLERALGVEGGEDPVALVAQLAEGNRLTLNLFRKALADAGIEELDPTGEPFNPELHQAITARPTAQVAPNHVVEVMQKGYRLHERLIRPAMVVVAQAPEEPAGQEDNAAQEQSDERG